MRLGVTREIMHELSSSDQFGEFRHWFAALTVFVTHMLPSLVDCFVFIFNVS